jgi:hypothetical protein
MLSFRCVLGAVARGLPGVILVTSLLAHAQAQPMGPPAPLRWIDVHAHLVAGRGQPDYAGARFPALYATRNSSEAT